MSENNQQQPMIQVRKVSQLDDYATYSLQKTLAYNNSYLLVGYPAFNEDTQLMPHNFKISLQDIQEISYAYVSNILIPQFNQTISNIRADYDAKFELLLSYIAHIMRTNPDISAYWNRVGDYIKQYYGKDYIDYADTVLTYTINGETNYVDPVPVI
jgi:hypothetical protein